jgi:hypothetical protein
VLRELRGVEISSTITFAIFKKLKQKNLHSCFSRHRSRTRAQVENNQAQRSENMPLAIIDGPTIARGESLSDGIDCSSGEIVRITVPQEFTQANLTFQVSTDGNFYNDLFDDDGDEITVVAEPDAAVYITRHWVRAVAFLKLRSGSRDAPVEQREDCKFAIAVLTP